MSSLGLGDESHQFDRDTIESLVDEDMIGNYALGHDRENGNFVPKYVGRSDTDLRVELIARLGTHPHPRFKFRYADSVQQTYERECNNYHDFLFNSSGGRQLENEIHPPTPEDMDLECPQSDRD